MYNGLEFSALLLELTLWDHVEALVTVVAGSSVSIFSNWKNRAVLLEESAHATPEKAALGSVDLCLELVNETYRCSCCLSRIACSLSMRSADRRSMKISCPHRERCIISCPAGFDRFQFLFQKTLSKIPKRTIGCVLTRYFAALSAWRARGLALQHVEEGR